MNSGTASRGYNFDILDTDKYFTVGNLESSASIPCIIIHPDNVEWLISRLKHKSRKKKIKDALINRLYAFLKVLMFMFHIPIEITRKNTDFKFRIEPRPYVAKTEKNKKTGNDEPVFWVMKEPLDFRLTMGFPVPIAEEYGKCVNCHQENYLFNTLNLKLCRSCRKLMPGFN
jgi:hypothetical protein